jgi:uncharacterized protein (DUF1015 family)
MATLRAFKALRPPKDRAAQVSAVPYDVVTAAEARRLAAGIPLSFLHVSRAEIDLPDGVDPYSEEVYKKASHNFEKLKRDGGMLIEDAPSLYIYRLRMKEHEQTGIAACCSIREYDSDLIRKHERTRQDKEDDRTRHMLALGAQTGPVFLTYRGRRKIDEIVTRGKDADPLYDFVAPDGIQHTIWRLRADLADDLTRMFADVPLLYIADGHHRAASASRAAHQLSGQVHHDLSPAEFEYFLAVVFPADQLKILAYNRVIKDLNGMDPEGFLRALKARFAVNDHAGAEPETKGQIKMYLGGRWYSLAIGGNLADSNPQSAISLLDVSILDKNILDPLLGIKDVRTDRRIDFVGGIRGPGALEKIVDEGGAMVAFSMYPVSLDELMTIADTGQTMPPKSTWFEPKLRDGLLIHMIK